MENRQLPNDINTEQSVLAYMLMSGSDKEMLDILDLANESMFFDPINMAIFKTIKMQAVKNRGSISQRVVEQELLEKEGYKSDHIENILINAPISANYEVDIKKLLDMEIKRKLIFTSREVLHKAFSGLNGADLLEETQKNINTIDANQAETDILHISEIGNQIMKDVEYQIKNPSVRNGLLTGYDTFDKVLGGFEPKDLVILGAKPSMGKTAFSLNLLKRVCLFNKVPGLFISLETSDKKLVQRMLANEGRFNSYKFKTADFTKKGELSNLDESIYNISQLKLYLDDKGGLDPEGFRKKCRYAVKKLGVKFVVLDYLGILSLKGNRYEAVTNAIDVVQQTAQELDFSILCLSQLSRNLDNRENKKPRNSDLRESGNIEQAATKIVFLYRESEYSKVDPHLQNRTEAIITKNKDGLKGIIDFDFNMPHMTFREVAKGGF